MDSVYHKLNYILLSIANNFVFKTIYWRLVNNNLNKQSVPSPIKLLLSHIFKKSVVVDKKEVLILTLYIFIPKYHIK